jgi:hypothetical protein
LKKQESVSEDTDDPERQIKTEERGSNENKSNFRTHHLNLFNQSAQSFVEEKKLAHELTDH